MKSNSRNASPVSISRGLPVHVKKAQTIIRLVNQSRCIVQWHQPVPIFPMVHDSANIGVFMITEAVSGCTLYLPFQYYPPPPFLPFYPSHFTTVSRHRAKCNFRLAGNSLVDRPHTPSPLLSPLPLGSMCTSGNGKFTTFRLTADCLH